MTRPGNQIPRKSTPISSQKTLGLVRSALVFSDVQELANDGIDIDPEILQKIFKIRSKDRFETTGLA